MAFIQVFGALFIIFLIGYIVSWKEMKHAFKTNFALSNKSLVLLPPDLFKEAWFPFLNTYFPYFQQLNNEGKENFKTRLIQNLKDLEIIGKEGLELNDEMRILLCASLTQLTFGFKLQGLRGYKGLHIYPRAFYSKYYNGLIESVSYKENIIALSWIDYEKGILNNSDGKDLGLAEFSNALLQTVKNGERFELSFASYLDRWMEVVSQCEQIDDFFDFIHADKHGYKVDIIFPKSIVMFFEKSYEFKNRFHSIYAHMCVLMNQNPLNITANYSYNSDSFKTLKLSTPLPKKIEVKYQNLNWHWSYNLLFVSLFGFPFIAPYFVASYHVINFPELFIYCIATGLAATLFTRKLNRKYLLFSTDTRLLLYNLFVAGPLLFTLLLLINDTITFSSTKDSHAISSMRKIYEGGGRRRASFVTDLEFEYKDNYLANYPFARRVSETNADLSKIFESTINYEIKTGCLGFKYISKKEIEYPTQQPEF